MRNKIYAILLITLMLVSTAVQAGAAVSDIKTISLKDAMDFAVKNSSSLKLLDEKIKVADRRYNTAVARSKDAVTKYWGTDLQHIANKMDEVFYPIQTLATLNDLKWQKDNKILTLNLDVTVLYFQVLFKQQQIDNHQNSIKRMNNEYLVKKKQVQLGTLNSSALLPLEVAIDEASTKLITMQRDKAKLEMDINNKLGFDINQKLSLISETIPYSEYKIEDLDKLIAGVLEKAHSIKKLESDKNLAEQEYSILMSYSMVEKPEGAESKEDNILNLGYSIQDEKVAVELKVRSDYNNILNLWDDITIKKLSDDKATKLLDTAKLKYNRGLINAIDLASAQGDKDSAQIDLKQAELAYNTAVVYFKNYIL